MSLITRCPACQTLFKVVPDQLRISEGWVRCGQCDGVFDASQHLLQEPPTPELPQVPVAPPVVAEEPVEPYSITPPAPEPTPTPPEVEDPAEPIFEEVPVPAPQIQHEALSAVPNAAPTPASDPVIEILEAPAVSFMREMPAPSVWRQPLVRFALGLTGFVLALVLGLQIVIHERDRIVAMEPQTRPALEAVCRPVNCRLSPLRQIESIVIDNSSFARIRSDAYRLGLSIKNNAAVELAMPALELTLTDSLDQTVLRRVLLPTEFGAPSAALAAGGDWSGVIGVNLRTTASTDRISGYRVLAFYP